MILKTLIFFLTITFYVLQISTGQSEGKRLVCYYDVDSYINLDVNGSKNYLDKALPHCTHLVYGFARLHPETNELVNATQYPYPAALKRRYPHLKIYLSVGGDKDYDIQDPLKYVRFLESGNHRRFINSSLETLKWYGFNGLDLAFALPRNEPRKETSVSMFLKDVTKLLPGSSQTDEYKHLYTRFVGNLKEAYNAANLTLTMTVLPNVNSTWFFDIPKIHNNFEFINLFAFDFNTPERNPKEADYSAPLHFNNEQNRLSYANINFQIDYWVNNGCPARKLNLGIATYGRVWKLTVQTGKSGQPVVEDTDGPGHVVRRKQNKGGSISWTDICWHLPPTKRNSGILLRKVFDNYGNYAFCKADSNNKNGYWISFDDPDFATTKAKYAKDKELGGVALYDLENDDFRGRCTRLDYPILRSVRKALDIRPYEVPRTYANALKWMQ